jgi:hypothetical protein
VGGRVLWADVHQHVLGAEVLGIAWRGAALDAEGQPGGPPLAVEAGGGEGELDGTEAHRR